MTIKTLQQRIGSLTNDAIDRLRAQLSAPSPMRQSGGGTA